MRMRLGTLSMLLVGAAAVVACGNEDEGTGSTDQSIEACLRRTCGNGKIDRYEECDGSNLNNRTCASETMGARPYGTLKCNRCKVDTRQCSKTNNGSGGTGGISGGSGGTAGKGGSGGTAGKGGSGGTAGKGGSGGKGGTGGIAGG